MELALVQIWVPGILILFLKFPQDFKSSSFLQYVVAEIGNLL